MIEFTREEALLLGFKDQANGDLLVIFFVKGRGFFKGILRAETKANLVEESLFQPIYISYFDMEDSNDLLAITQLIFKEEAQDIPQAF